MAGGSRPGKRVARAPVEVVLDFLAREYPGARVLLDHRSPFELLVATVLAAQCTDERVNEVTPALFRRYAGPNALASASLPELEAAVRPTGFYRIKAKALRGLAQALAARHGGKVPQDMAALTALPGSGARRRGSSWAPASGAATRFRSTRTSEGSRTGWALRLRRTPSGSKPISRGPSPRGGAGSSPRASAGTGAAFASPGGRGAPRAECRNCARRSGSSQGAGGGVRRVRPPRQGRSASRPARRSSTGKGYSPGNRGCRPPRGGWCLRSTRLQGRPSLQI